MKRAFSMKDLGSAIDHSAASDSSTVGKDDTPASPESETPPLSLRRSKSMNALDGGESDAEEPTGRLPSIATLGLSSKNLAEVHGLEVLKRGAQASRGGGGITSLPRSLSNSSLSQLIAQDEDIGAASALMELCKGNKKEAAEAPPEPGAHEASAQAQIRADSAPSAPAVALPSLRELLGAPSAMPAAAMMGMNEPSVFGRPQGVVGWDDRTAAMLGAQVQAYQQLAAAKSQGDSPTHRAASQMTSPAARSPQSAAGAGAGEDVDGDGKHNKYCHFCQHVKVKRATSMLACENAECARRFCEHCLKTHLNNVTPSDGKGIHDSVNGKWLCPICRKVCCCAIQSCEKTHRHCKAYRYRQRRAEQAAKRTMASESSRSKAAPTSGAMLAPDAHLLGHHAAAQQAQHWAQTAFGAHPAAFSASQLAAAQASHAAQGMMQEMQRLQLQSQLQGAHGRGFGGAPSDTLAGMPIANMSANMSGVAGMAGPEGLRTLGMPAGPPYMHFQQ